MPHTSTVWGVQTSSAARTCWDEPSHVGVLAASPAQQLRSRATACGATAWDRVCCQQLLGELGD